MPRGENLAADRPQKVRAGKTAGPVGDFDDADELVRLKAARKFVADVMVDPETASKDRPPLVRSFMEVDAKIVALEESRKATAAVTPISAAPSRAFDAARFA
jgi:hypothetical protein